MAEVPKTFQFRRLGRLASTNNKDQVSDKPPERNRIYYALGEQWRVAKRGKLESSGIMEAHNARQLRGSGISVRSTSDDLA